MMPLIESDSLFRSAAGVGEISEQAGELDFRHGRQPLLAFRPVAPSGRFTFCPSDSTTHTRRSAGRKAHHEC